MISHRLALSDYCKWTEISLSALHHNLNMIRKQAPQSEVMGIVKANAYGHNVSIIASALLKLGVSSFGVATLEEALYLREIAPKSTILILGALLPTQFEKAIVSGFEFMLYDIESAKKIIDLAKKHAQVAKVHLKIDTGMGRVGILPSKLREIIPFLNSKHLIWKGVCSHLATSDQAECPQTQAQLESFQTCLNGLSLHENMSIHTANSDAIFQWPQSHFSMIRPGISLYGYSSIPGLALQPVLSLKAKITQVKTLPEGHGIGYGRLYITQEPQRVGIIPLGYADGLNRSLTGLEVHIEGVKTQLLGRISMDQCVVDLKGLPQVNAGSTVTFIGPELNADIWAERLNTIHYEVLTGLGGRLPRFVKD